MYRSNPSRGSFRGRGFSPHSSGGRGPRRFSGPPAGRGRKVKKLDPMLFISKAKATAVAAQSKPVTHSSFNEFEVVDILKNTIAQKGYTAPTPIQDEAIPAMLAGRDVIGIANTGTGKTAAFLIPIINKAFKNPGEKALIVAPTRELALQIQTELRSLTRGMQMYSVLAIGGASLYFQKKDLQRGFTFVVGTPGRLIDLIQEKVLYLDEFRTIVLDEVDRMLDIGFIKDVQYLISLLPQERQSLFFSATITPKVQQVINSFVTDPVTISVKTHQTSHNVEQDIVRVTDPSKKVDQLHDLLSLGEVEKAIVFARTKRGVEKLYQTLSTRGFRVSAIHGNKSQGQRQRALESFRRNNTRVLLATDVASRGIDVKDVTHVINYDAPESYDDYVHRIGRTGRANKKGVALTFVE